MSGLLGGLGAFAGGLGQGLERGQQMQARQLQIDSERQRLKDEAALRADTDAANGAAASTMKGFQDAHAASQPSAMRNYLTLGGSDGSMATDDQPGSDTPVAKATPFQLTEQQVLQAAQARTNELFKRGRYEPAIRQWAADEGLRQQIRRTGVEKGLQIFRATGDAAPLINNIYPALDDGFKLDGVQRIKSDDPSKPDVWRVSRTSEHTGESNTFELPGDKVESMAESAIDPVQARKYSYESKLVQVKAAEKKAEDAANHEAKLKEIQAQGGDALKRLGIQIASNQQIAKGHDAARISAAQISAAASGKANGPNAIHSVAVDDDGNTVMIMRDGSTRQVTDDDGQPIGSFQFTKMVNDIAGHLQKDDSNLSREDAMAAARASMPKKPAKPKPKLTLGDAVGGSSPDSFLGQATNENVGGLSLGGAPGFQAASPAPQPRLTLGGPAGASPAASAPRKLVYDPATGSFK